MICPTFLFYFIKPAPPQWHYESWTPRYGFQQIATWTRFIALRFVSCFSKAEDVLRVNNKKAEPWFVYQFHFTQPEPAVQ